MYKNACTGFKKWSSACSLVLKANGYFVAAWIVHSTQKAVQ